MQERKSKIPVVGTRIAFMRTRILPFKENIISDPDPGRTGSEMNLK
jgi:hypothetical protein